MKLLTYGSRGPQVQFLQLALNRADCGPVATDGIYGYHTAEAVRSFQRKMGIAANGKASQRTHSALMPYYTGYFTHAVGRGDTFYNLARRYHTSLRAIETANPNTNAAHLHIGSLVTVPLSFPVVPTGINWSSDVLDCVIDGLCARYPFLRSRTVGRSAMGKPLYALTIGNGRRKVLYNAAHHANEWITTPILLRFAEELAAAYAKDTLLHNIPAAEILKIARFVLVPCVNPDGMDLVTGFLSDCPTAERTARIAEKYPNIPYPDGWKANIRGVDLNLQYPAAWEQARDIKAAQGYTSPAPRDYVGTAPLTQPEARAMVRLTELVSPDRILAYHTQGEVIFPNFMDFEPRGAKVLAWRLAAASGYDVLETPPESAYAGYKDWFIQTYNRPGYTIEAGLGNNPLPMEDFDKIYAHNLPILVLTATLDT
ncbi:MAG: peptidoglycan-binding protein [Oscillospiraceae bacterium]|nr:peptidoglycan-binding protein [Oscillospiraceae bacterium]